MCQEHSRKYHKQELQNIMLPRCWLQGLGVRRGSWHPHHREKGSRAPCFSARLYVTQSARPFQLQSVRFWLLSLLQVQVELGCVHVHTLTHRTGETAQT